MKKFLLLLHEDIEKMRDLSPTQMEALQNARIAWATKLAESEHFISGDGLHENGVLIIGKDCVIKGGYYLLQTDDLNTIVKIAEECPCHLWGGTTEIRPIMDMEEYEQ